MQAAEQREFALKAAIAFHQSSNMGASLFLILALAMCPPAMQAAEQREFTQSSANPVRKVVTMLQAMQKKTEAEGEKEEELYKKFMCYCKTGTVELANSIASANTKSPSLGADIKASEEQLVQTKQELQDAQKERSDAKAAIATAAAMRQKEAAAFAAEKGELESYIDTVAKAVAALEKGMAGAFLQTGAAEALRKIVLSKGDNILDDEEGLLSFLSGKQDASYVPSSAEVTGMLKQMGDSMSKSLAEAVAAEEAAVKNSEALVAAKKREVDTLTASIESKTTKVGELSMAIVQMKGDLSDTEETLLEDKKMLAELEKGCTTKDDEYAARVKTRTEELAALAETIKILNDDDALELFKKTLPSPSASLVQVEVSAAQKRERAMDVIKKVQMSGETDRARLDLLVLALRGKKIGFAKVIGMIDEMVASLKAEQVDDDNKKEYCAKQFDDADDKKKALERTVSDTQTAIASAEEGISALTAEISAAEKAIEALDDSVAEATEQRKEEHAEYKALMQSDGSAKELLGFAKNRLNRFYNPKLYKPPAKEELSSAGAIERNMGGAAVLAQISEHVQRKNGIAPPPETWA